MALLADVAAYPREWTLYALIAAIALIAVVLSAVGVFLLLYLRKRKRGRRP